MLRFGKQLPVCLRAKKNWPHLRTDKHLSSSANAGYGNNAKVVGTLGAVAVVGTGGVVAYAKFNEDFRESTENRVPFTKSLFNAVLGESAKLPTIPKTKQTVEKSSLRGLDAPASKLRISKDPENVIPIAETKEDVLPLTPIETNLTKEGDNTVPTQTTITESTVYNSTRTNSTSKTEENNNNESANTERYTELTTESSVKNNLDLLGKTEDSNAELEPELPVTVAEENIATLNIDSNNVNKNDVKSTEDSMPSETPTDLVSETHPKENDGVLSSPVERTAEEVQLSLYELEKDILADAAASKSIIENELADCAHKCIESISNCKEAREAITLHTKLVRAAMDSKNDTSGKEKNQQWEDVTQVLEQKTRLESLASSSYQAAREQILKLRSIIDQAKTSKHEGMAEVLIDADDHLNKMTQELEECALQVDMHKSESRVLLQYQELAEHAKEQFRKELLSVMPDVNIKPGWRGLSNKLSQDDLNAIIAHAHRRIDQLQRELAEERSLSSHKIEEAVHSTRQLIEEKAARDVAKKVELEMHEMENELQRKLNEARQMYENEMRLQLKRQAAAHSEHLADVLTIRDQQLSEQHRKDLAEKLDEQHARLQEAAETQMKIYEDELRNRMEQYQLNLGKALARVAGVEAAIDGRAEIENESRKAQELWLACEALRVALKYGDQGIPIPLKSELEAITNIYGEDSNMAAVAATFPQKSCERGVFTAEAIRNSFNRVSKLCRRLSMVNENRNSLLTYILSYLKSLLIISSAKEAPPSNIEDANLDDTFKLVSYANYCVENGKLELAARLMNQLTGEPKRIAEGWLTETRLYLETQQAVDALLAMASAVNIACNLEE